MSFKKSESKKPQNHVKDAYRRELYRKLLLALSGISFAVALACGGVLGYNYYTEHQQIAAVENLAKEVVSEASSGDVGNNKDSATNKASSKGDSSQSIPNIKIRDLRGKSTGSSGDSEVNSSSKSFSKSKGSSYKRGISSSKKNANNSYDESYNIVSSSDIDKNLLRKINFTKLKRMNPDVSKWLYLPGTGINSYVMQERRVGNYYYLWRDINKRLNDYGSLFSPAVPGGRSAQDLIFGHRTFGTFGDVVFAKLPEYFASKTQAEKHRYIYLYYPDHSERWKVYLAKDTTSKDPVYQVPYDLGTKEYSDLLAKLRVKSRFLLADAPTFNTHTLVLSTCNSSVRTNVRYIVVFLPDLKFTYSNSTLEDLS